MTRASYNRKGECPEGHNVAHVTFDEGKNDKLYAYWTPPGWDVQPGDKLHVMVSEREARKWTTVRSVGGLMPMGAEHKTALGHTPMPRERKLLKEMEAQGNVAIYVDDLMDFKPGGFNGYDDHLFLEIKAPHPRDVAIKQLQAYRDMLVDRMIIPPGLLTAEKVGEMLKHQGTVTGRITGRITLPYPSLQDNIPKETTVMINMETITYLNGKPIKQATDAEMFEAIRQTEAEIKGLMGIETKPKALKERMLKLQADIDALVAYMDAR